MSKTSGLGMGCAVDGYDLSGDIGALDQISGGPAPIDVTGINKSAYERIGGQRSGNLQFTAFFNPAPNQEHAVLSTLPTSDGQVLAWMPGGIGAPGVALVGKQIDYPVTRGTDGTLTEKVETQSNAYGLEWGLMLTAGYRTDSAATNGASLDGGASSSFGGQAYLQVSAFTGTDVTVKLQDSADNSSFTDISGAAFTQITSTTPQAQRLGLSNTATVRRYVRAVTVTTGGFTSVSFAVMFVRNPIAGVTF